MDSMPLQSTPLPHLAPPKLDLDWKHLVQYFAGPLGIDAVTLWILGGLLSFFLLRATLTKIVVEAHDRIHKYETIGLALKQTEARKDIQKVIKSQKKSLDISLFRLFDKCFTDEHKHLSACMLLVAGRSVKLLEFEDRCSSKAVAATLCSLSLALWHLLYRFFPDYSFIVAAIGIALAWSPVAFLTYFAVRCEELHRAGIKLSKRIHIVAEQLGLLK